MSSRKYDRKPRGPKKHSFNRADPNIINSRDLINIQSDFIEQELKQIRQHKKILKILKERNKGRLNFLIDPKLKLLWRLESSLELQVKNLRKLWFITWCSKKRQKLEEDIAILEEDVLLIRGEYSKWETFCRGNCRFRHTLIQSRCIICLDHRQSRRGGIGNESSQDEILE